MTAHVGDKHTYGEEAFEAQTIKRKNAEAVEAGLSQGRKCHKKEREKAASAAAAPKPRVKAPV